MAKLLALVSLAVNSSLTKTTLAYTRHPMDYIPQPLSSVTPPIIVPLAAIIPYELGSFEDFPRRYGFAEEGGRLDLNTRTVPEVATVLQSWLYFGLLSEFLGRSVESQELAQKATLPDGSIIDRVSTNQLSDLFQKSVLDLKGRKGELWSLLEFANDQSRLVDTQLPSVSPVSEIMLSIKILLLTLSDFAFPNPEKYHPNLDVRPLDILSINVISPATKLLVDRMESAGWCPQQVIQLCTQYNYAVVYYLSQLHRRYRKGLSHSDCSGSQCVANHIDMKSYPVQHACAPCSCTSISTEEDIEVFHDSAEEPLVSPLCRRCSCCDIKVDAEKLRQIVSEGGVPLISIQQTDNGKITLGVEKFKNSSRYVAISHVWSDGMGNPDDNALPQCILARMAAHFETLPFSPCEHPSSWLTGLVAYTKHIVQLAGFRIEDNSPQLFWMDTLCIPVGDDHVHLRKMAINQMALIYAAASQVLILDSELQRVRIGGSQEAEVLGHILTCAWKTRCWTLQEGAIAQARRYQMLDGVMDLETKRPSRRSLLFGRMTVRIVFLHLFPSFLQSFRQRMIKSWKSSRKNMNIYRSRELENFDGFVQQKLTSNLRVGCRERLQGFWDWPARNAIGQANPKALYVQFVAVWNALGCRTTTQREDLCLILASLLDLNSYVLIGMDSYDEKMKILLWTVGRLPLSLLYNTGKRVQADQDHSNRWVPGEPSSCFLEQEPSVKLSEDSLVLKSKNLSKTNSVFLIASLANIKNLNDKLILEDANNGSRYIIEFLRQPNDKIDIGLYTSFGMLVEGHLYSDAIPEGLETRGACLLTNWTVFASQEEGSNGETTIRAKYDCPLRVWPYNAETSAIGIAISSRTTPDDNQKILMGMRPTGPWKLKIEAGTLRVFSICFQH